MPVPLDAAFAFFADAWNLQRITPPWLHFRILTPPPVEMREGLFLDYRIALHGLPMRWRTRIDVWEPGVRFVDRQVRGPYRVWRHEHTFEAVSGGTLVRDHVAFLPPLAWLTGRWVARDVARIFEYRREALLRELSREIAPHRHDS